MCVCVCVCVCAFVSIAYFYRCYKSVLMDGVLNLEGWEAAWTLKEIDSLEQVEERRCSAFLMQWRHGQGNSFLKIRYSNLIG